MTCIAGRDKGIVGYRVLLLLTMVIFSGCGAKEAVMKTKSCKVVYHFSNPSLGPVNGEREFSIRIVDGNVMEVTDLATGRPAKRERGIPGLSRVLEACRGERKKGIRYHYDGYGRLKEISPSASGIGGGFRITIKKWEYDR